MNGATGLRLHTKQLDPVTAQGAYQAGQPTGWPVPDGLEVGFGLTPWKKTEFWGSPAGFGGRIRSGIVYLGCFAGTRLEKEEGFEARL